MLGDYADKGAADMLLATKGDRHPTEKADLVGKRLIICVETDEGRRLHESLAKELTGGDRIKARFMHENFFTFTPSHSIVLVTNHKPRIYGTDNGIWRRLRSIPFNQVFWDADRGETGPAELRADKQLREKLRGEYGGVLRGSLKAVWHGNATDLANRKPYAKRQQFTEPIRTCWASFSMSAACSARVANKKHRKFGRGTKHGAGKMVKSQPMVLGSAWLCGIAE